MDPDRANELGCHPVLCVAGRRIVLPVLPTGRDSSSYATDGRYFGRGTSNYDYEVDFGGNSQIAYGTIGAVDKADARAKLIKKYGSKG